MKAEQFQVIGDLYRFLATYDAEALAAASRQQGLSPNLRSALSALALEGSAAAGAACSHAQPKRKAPPSPSKRRLLLSRELSVDAYRDSLLPVLMDTKRFPDKQALMRFAAKVGLSITPDTRISRERLAGQIARRISEDPALRESLSSMLSGAGDDQTEGWLNLILNTH